MDKQSPISFCDKAKIIWPSENLNFASPEEEGSLVVLPVQRDSEDEGSSGRSSAEVEELTGQPLEPPSTFADSQEYPPDI